MNNVLQLIQHPIVGGLEKMVLTLCQQSKYSNKMVLVALEGRTNRALSAWPTLSELYHFECLDKQPGISYQTVKKLIKLVDEWGIDTIHSHHIGPLFYGAMVKMHRPHVKHIHTMHDAWYLNNFKQRLLTKLVHSLSKVTIVTDANAVASELTQQTSIKADHVVHNGIDTQLFRPFSKYLARCRLGLPTGIKLVGCAARVEKGKGHIALIDSLKSLPHHVHLVFAGDGSQREFFTEYGKEKSLQERIHWLGKVEAMPLFYSAIDIFCLFSEREGLPLTLLEAMACNIPVIASDVGGVKEIVSKQSGILLNVNMAYCLPDAIQRGLSLQNGTKVRAHALELGCSKKMTKRYDCLYESIKS